MSPVETLLMLSVSELQKRLSTGEVTHTSELLRGLEADPRAGARALARRLRQQSEKEQLEGQRLQRLLKFERKLQGEGHTHIAGVDEAGMAPLAGPVVAGAVILPLGYTLRGLDDSKKILNEKRREALAAQLKADAVAWATGWASVEEVDALNIYHAGLLAMRRAVEGLSQVPTFCLVDARTIPNLSMPQQGIIQGDTLSLSIAAASVIAKTTRDAYMKEMDARYPGYGFARHKGYPTPEHQKALKALGAVPIHRKTFEMVKEVL